jgi:hypothetical protein
LLDEVTEWTDRVFYRGDLVCHGGSTWQATKDTAKPPGNGDWRLIAAAGAAGASMTIRGTYSADTSYRALDVVTLDYGWFVARIDNPGRCPGPDWQAGPVGRRGDKGPKGERGDSGPQGPAGKSAPHWIGVRSDGYNLVAVMSDGTVGPRISLTPLFEQFDAELKLRSK